MIALFLYVTIITQNVDNRKMWWYRVAVAVDTNIYIMCTTIMTPVISYKMVIAAFSLDIATIPFYLTRLPVVNFLLITIFDCYMLHKKLKNFHKLFMKKKL